MKMAILIAALLALASPVAAQTTISGLPAASTPLSGSEVVPLVQGGVTKQTPVSSLPVSYMVSVRAYGAQGNANGVHGVGNDDTAAFQAAFNAAAALRNAQNQSGGVVYIPCGTYRLTSTITGNIANTSYHIRGDGACSQIFNDSVAPADTFVFQPAASCMQFAPCLSIEDIYFIPENNPDPASWAVVVSNMSSPVFRNVQIGVYGHGIELFTSYAPSFLNNVFDGIKGAAVDCINDTSCNNALFWGNRAYFNGLNAMEPVFEIGGIHASGCTTNVTNVSIIGNDIESGYSGPQFYGVCSVTLQDNYIASNTGGPPFAFGAYHNSEINIRGNFFAEDGASMPYTWALSNVQGVDFGPNTWFDQSVTWTGLTAINWSATQDLTGTSTLQNYCSPSMNCTYVGNGWIRQWGVATTSGSGSVAVTFPLACPTAAPTDITATDTNGTNLNVWVTTPSTTGMTVNSSVFPATVNWGVTCH